MDGQRLKKESVVDVLVVVVPAREVLLDLLLSFLVKYHFGFLARLRPLVLALGVVFVEEFLSIGAKHFSFAIDLLSSYRHVTECVAHLLSCLRVVEFRVIDLLLFGRCGGGLL